MGKLFVDNQGKVYIHDKAIALPGSMRVTLGSEQSDIQSRLGGNIPVFISGITHSRASRFAAKQSLIGDFTIIPFGEAPGAIGVRGIVFTAGQYDTKRGSGAAAYDRLMEYTPRKVKAISEPAQDKTQMSKWASKVKGFTESATKKVGSALSKAGSALSAAASKANAVLGEVKAAALAITSLPRSIAGQIKSALGLAGGAPAVPVPLSPDDMTPLSFQQMQSVFDVAHLGVKTSGGVADRPQLTISCGGVIFYGGLEAISFKSMQGNQGFEFEMSLKLFEKPVYVKDDISPTISTRGNNGLLGQVGGALLETGISAVRRRTKGLF